MCIRDSPCYEQVIRERLNDVLRDPEQPIHRLLSKEASNDLLQARFDYGKPWFGQLMSGPQLMAYLLQVNIWMNRYKIKVVL